MINADLLKQLIEFRRERDWEQFHNPKDIAISLSIEAAELLEWFQWRNKTEIKQMLETDKREDLEDEIADVAVYLSYLCHDLNIDIEQAIQRKMQKNAAKYPVDKVKGRADKYNEYS
ncbi:MAG TPA: nucleotide pyrophosphohydrolase [Methylophaga sp.]|jgi:NTP pyrophosphatase (non-canonical NTP hydrolase)|uniref:nucleotide pyrophosphohydrolase n=1 Tax=unclassified Methylophaga TaxID=2629249 RepID=UPI000C90885A|nr:MULTISPECIES: nucleotide pyrophosphohydrolase [unclassified Methylophaga]MAP27084.1 nucleotide pyrophosphohydrolase [Methylophaga sp.]HAD30985.1 nucleotide pyrophosphohydrolase [Methylophaga sp.]HBX59632.1 nucleotide pyrophosphohydrolase [Methylophaga sp.]|tara:strand:- start:3075 stop:3425 length:351 start_codon:yes stop_codon:yes gene_type:complete